MHDRDSETPLEAEARRLYRRSADELDVATRSRLARARGAALRVRPRPYDGRWWLPVAATAAAAAVTVAVLLTGGGEEDPIQLAAAEGEAEDVELLLAAESLDMLSELDFYLWLDAEPDSG